MCIFFFFFCIIGSFSLIHVMLGHLILIVILTIIAFAGYKVYMCLREGSGGVACDMMLALKML